MGDDGVDVIVATGGTASCVPPIAPQPVARRRAGNMPALVERRPMSPPPRAAWPTRRRSTTRSCAANESVAIVEEHVAATLERELERHRARGVLDEEGRAGAPRPVSRRDGSMPRGWPARMRALWRRRPDQVPAGTRVCWWARVPADRAGGAAGAREAVPAARAGPGPRRRARDRRRPRAAAVGGTGHSAVIHSRDVPDDPRLRRRGRVLRVSVDAAGSTAWSGLDTNLAPTMTVGTRFFGRSA